MHLLFIVPYAPTPIRVRPYQLLKTLAGRGHHISLFTLVQSTDEESSLDTLRQLGIKVTALPLSRGRSFANILRTIPSALPLQANYCWHPDLAYAVHQHLAASHFDAIHIEHLRGACYGVWLKRKLPLLDVPIIFDSVDCITYLFEQTSLLSQSMPRRIITRFELNRTRRYESMLVRLFSQILVTSQVDQMHLQQIGSSQLAQHKIQVLLNGVDLEAFHPGATHSSDTVVFSGKMSYHANITAVQFLVQEIMPLVWARRPQTRLLIAGSRPPQHIRNLQADTRIEVTGYVTNMGKILREATVAIAPMLYGAGIQNKVIEAMACATPIVASPQAVAALPVTNGVEVLLASSPQAFADNLVAILGDQILRDRMSKAALHYAQNHHQWDNIASQLEAIYIAANMR